MTNAEYRAAPGISKSNLFKIAKSPAFFRYEMDNPKPPTPDFIFGQAFHKAVLEPDGFDSEFVVLPKLDLRTNAGKAALAEITEYAQGKSIITQDDFDTIYAMRNSVMSNKYAKALLTGEIEQSYFWTDDITGERCKCRPDVRRMLGDQPCLTDLKSCRSADTESFMRDSINYGYDVQAGQYTEGLYKTTGQTHKFFFVCVEKTAPYLVNILECDELFMRHGTERFRELLGIYAECNRTGNWWGYEGHSGLINTLSLPVWLANQYL